jgi:SAM-dependent methyltransferase
MNSSTAAVADHRTWESAEVLRSDIEAAATPDASLVIGPKKLQRYARPPADTAFPLEYCYHLLGDVTGQRVLDIGCGSGMNSVLTAKHGGNVTGIDISPSLTRLATRRARLNSVGERVNVMVTSAHDLPFASNSFDVVLGIAILHHLDLRAASIEVHRVLKRGGRAIFQEPVRNSELVKRVRAMIPYTAPDVSPYERPLTDQELNEFSRGFTVSRTRVFSLPHVNLAAVLPVVRDRINVMYRMDRALLRRFPSLEPYATARVVELVKR